MTFSLSNVASLCNKAPFFVYPWGTNASYGFAAVYSGFAKTLTLCIRKGVGYRFVKVQRPMGIALDDGYSDFFLPFCDEASGFLLDRLNRDPLPFQAKLPFIKNAVSLSLRLSATPGAQYFLFSPQLTQLPNVPLPDELSIYENDDFQLRAELANALWRFRPDINASIKAIVASLVEFQLSADYYSVVIRRGDKILESNYASLDLYVESICSAVSEGASIFIASDDFDSILELERRLPGYKCFYLPPPFRDGYSNKAFRDLSSDSRRKALLQFLAQVEILRSARCFFATRTTNVSFMVNTLRRGNQVYWVD